MLTKGNKVYKELTSKFRVCHNSDVLTNQRSLMFEQEEITFVEDEFDVNAFLDTYYKELQEVEEFIDYFIN